MYNSSGPGSDSCATLAPARRWWSQPRGDLLRHQRWKSQPRCSGLSCDCHCTAPRLTFTSTGCLVDGRQLVGSFCRLVYDSSKEYIIYVDIPTYVTFVINKPFRSTLTIWQDWITTKVFIYCKQFGNIELWLKGSYRTVCNRVYNQNHRDFVL